MKFLQSFLIPGSVVFVCLLSCNNAVVDNEKITATAADSAKQITVKYAANLADLTGNNNLKTIVCQGWQLQDDLETLTMSNDAEGMLPFRSFYLSSDATFVMNPRNSIVFGNWQMDENNKTITLNQADGGKTVYKIEDLQQKQLIVTNKSEGSTTQLKFVSAGYQYKLLLNDPFHTSNNTWRIAPKKIESDSAIRERLKGFVRFHILFYRDNLAKDEKSISFYGFPTCLRWYAGGIFLTKQKDLAANWYQCFYNKEQALKAYAMMDKALAKKYTWEKSRVNWVIKNLGVLEQISNQL